MRQSSPRQRVHSAIEVATLIGAILVTLSSVFSGDVTEAVLLSAVGLILTTQLEARFDTALRQSPIEHVTPTDRQKVFDELTRAPTEWMFRDGSGRWFRSVAVPAILKSATTYAPVRVALLDPRNENTCAACVRDRKRSGWYADHTVTPRCIQAEVLATIFTLMVAHSETRVWAQVGLINSYSPSRVDANGEYMIVTALLGCWVILSFAGGASADHWPYIDFSTGPLCAHSEALSYLGRFPLIASETIGSSRQAPPES
jgi:hypothetical protein